MKTPPVKTIILVTLSVSCVATWAWADCERTHIFTSDCSPSDQPSKCTNGCLAKAFSPHQSPTYCESVNPETVCAWSACQPNYTCVTETDGHETSLMFTNATFPNGICLACGLPSYLDPPFQTGASCENDYIPPSATECGNCSN